MHYIIYIYISTQPISKFFLQPIFNPSKFMHPITQSKTKQNKNVLDKHLYFFKEIEMKSIYF